MFDCILRYEEELSCFCLNFVFEFYEHEKYETRLTKIRKTL